MLPSMPLLLLAPTVVLAQDVEAEFEALELSFGREARAHRRQLDAYEELTVAAEAAPTPAAKAELRVQASDAALEAYWSALRLRDTAEQLQALAAPLPEERYGQLRARADRLATQAGNIAARGVVLVVQTHLRSAADWRAAGVTWEADHQLEQAWSFLGDHRAVLDTPTRVDDFYDPLLGLADSIGETAAARRLSEACLRECTRPDLHRRARQTLESQSQTRARLRAEGARLIHQLHGLPPGSSEAWTVYQQILARWDRSAPEVRDRATPQALLAYAVRLGRSGGIPALGQAAWVARSIRDRQMDPRLDSRLLALEDRATHLPAAHLDLSGGLPLEDPSQGPAWAIRARYSPDSRWFGGLAWSRGPGSEGGDDLYRAQLQVGIDLIRAEAWAERSPTVALHLGGGWAHDDPRSGWTAAAGAQIQRTHRVGRALIGYGFGAEAGLSRLFREGEEASWVVSAPVSVVLSVGATTHSPARRLHP